MRSVSTSRLLRLTRPVLLGAALLTASAQAAPPVFMDVATSPKGTTASDMFRDLGRVCTSASFLRQRQTSGSIDNLELLLDNKVSLAFVQLDVLKARDQIDQDPRAKDLRALLPLNFDELHLISRPVKKDLLGRQTGINKFSELKGKTLAVWGGSFVTANVLNAKTKLGIKIVNYPGREQAVAALGAGKADAVLAVAGQPVDWIRALNPAQFRLVPIDIPAGTLSDFYRPAKLNYGKLATGLPTYAVQRILVTRNFRTPDKRDALLKYQKCAISKLTELQETTGMHPKWSDVTFKEQYWPVYK